MAEATQPVSLRLTQRDLNQLRVRAHAVSGTLTGVARNLIRAGLAGGDSNALADRVMQIERRLVGLESLLREVSDRAEHIDRAAHDLRAKFDALLQVLSSDGAV